MLDDIRSQLRSVMEIGTKAYETLRKKRFVEKSVRFSSTIRWMNFKTFLSICKHEKENKGKSYGMKKEMPQSDVQLRLSVPEEGLWRNYFSCSMTFPLPRTCSLKI